MTVLTIHKETSRSDSLLLSTDLDGISCPDAWTAAPLTFRVSTDGITWVDATDPNGDLVVMQVIPGVFLPIPPGACKAGSYIILVSGMPNDPVPQMADREFSMNLVGLVATQSKKVGKDAGSSDRHK